VVAAVAVALLIGILLGLLVRPVLDMYLRWKTAQLYDTHAGCDDRAANSNAREHRL
jgi:hypothetical protein